MIEDRVFIAGAGPVGLVAAANLVRRGVPVTVFEAAPDLSEESRASTFHPPTVDMLADLGAARDLVAQGLVAPTFQYRSKRDGVIAGFDFGLLDDVTHHPHRLQCEQFKLTASCTDGCVTMRISASSSANVSTASRRPPRASRFVSPATAGAGSA